MGSWTVKDERKPRELVKEDSYYAVCIGLFDIGTQPAFKPGDRPQHQVVLEFELHDRKTLQPVRKSDGSVATISAFMGLSVGRTGKGDKTKLREYVEALVGGAFSDEECKAGVDIGAILEQVAQVVVENSVNDKGEQTGKQKIKTIMPVDDDVAARVSKLSELNSDAYQLAPGKEIPASVPKWLHPFIEKSTEWTTKPAAAESSAPRTNGRRGKAAPMAETAPTRAPGRRGVSDLAPGNIDKENTGAVAVDDEIPF